MNIFRVIGTPTADGDAGIMDLFYEKTEDNEFKCIDLKIYSIIDIVVGELLDINIVLKIAIAKNLIEILRTNENKNNNV
jgi:hypothetical protein